MSKRAFKDDKAFIDKFQEYIDHCREEELFANIAGFCVFADITRETFYKQKDYYSDTYKKIENILENSTLQDKNTTRMIFYLKNKFNYVDKQEIKSDNINHNLNDDVTQLSDEELNKKLKELKNKK